MIPESGMITIFCDESPDRTLVVVVPAPAPGDRPNIRRKYRFNAIERLNTVVANVMKMPRANDDDRGGCGKGGIMPGGIMPGGNMPGGIEPCGNMGGCGPPPPGDAVG
jgi:hypothetical protein